MYFAHFVMGESKRCGAVTASCAVYYNDHFSEWADSCTHARQRAEVVLAMNDCAGACVVRGLDVSTTASLGGVLLFLHNSDSVAAKGPVGRVKSRRSNRT
jgi:hypothetical protein